jgi:hypothetical protein
MRTFRALVTVHLACVMALVAAPRPRGLTHAEEIELAAVRFRRAVEQTHMTIVMRQRHG